jgi:Flp pilus assembly protein TadG
MRSRYGRRGSSLIEFTLIAVPLIFTLIGTFSISIGLWEYDTLAYAVTAGARYAAVKGQECATANGNTACATVGNIAQQVSNAAVGLPSGQMDLWLTTDSGAQTACTPLSTCLSNSTAWPPSANNDNTQGKMITISAQYTFNYGMGGSFNLPASSTQLIQF